MGARMSARRLPSTMAQAETSVTPMMMGMSTRWMACQASWPIPGQPNTLSTTTIPPMNTPMSIPIMTVAVILQVTGIWNDFLFGVIYAGPTNYPMTVQLNNIVNTGQGVKEYNVDMAATILTGIVPLAIYFFSGKYFVRGIAAGAVKG